jgi:ABC-type transport system involved in cytochrome c biogenesis permease component
VSARGGGTGSFRLLLFVGAAVSIAIGVWGVVWTRMLDTVLGLRTIGVEPGFSGLARLFGGVMLAVGVGYALAAAQPHRNRGLLVPLFIVPVALGVMTIAGAAREEIQSGKAIGFAAYNFAYCLFFFRLYPRLTTEEPPDSTLEGSSST